MITKKCGKSKKEMTENCCHFMGKKKKKSHCKVAKTYVISDSRKVSHLRQQSHRCPYAALLLCAYSLLSCTYSYGLGSCLALMFSKLMEETEKKEREERKEEKREGMKGGKEGKKKSKHFQVYS